MRKELSFGYYVMDFIFRKILRQNGRVNWVLHYTSTVHHPEKIVRGKEVYPGDSPGVYINAMNGVEIGDYTNIGPQAGILSTNHNFIDNAKYDPARPIRIGKYCWIGKNANILPEVVLGDFTIVGAGAIVTKSFEEGYCVIAGNPAKKIKELDKQACLSFAQQKQS